MQKRTGVFIFVFCILYSGDTSHKYQQKKWNLVVNTRDILARVCGTWSSISNNSVGKQTGTTDNKHFLMMALTILFRGNGVMVYESSGKLGLLSYAKPCSFNLGAANKGMFKFCCWKSAKILHKKN